MRVALCLLLVSASLIPIGCRHKHRNDPIVISTFKDFVYEGIFHDYTAIEQFDWKNPFDDALVDFEGVDFDGEIRVQIFDDDNFPVYDATFVGSGGDIFVEDSTAFGDPGEWVVIISSFNVSGFVRLDLF